MLELVEHKLDCTATEDGLRLKSLDLGSTCREIVLSAKQRC